MAHASGSPAQRAFGFLLIFLVALIWSLSSFISKSLVSHKPDDDSASVPPFVLTYLATSLFIVYLPFVYIRLWIKQRRLRNRSHHLLLTVQSTADEADGSDDNIMAKYEQDEKTSVQAAAWAGPLWFLAQYTFNISLVYTTVTSNTILSSASSLFTYIMSVLFLGETYTHTKLCSIMACIAGTALVALSDQKTGSSSTLWGDFLVVFSDCVYAVYTIVMKKYLPDEESANIPLFFGYIGLFVSVSLSPVVLIYVASGRFSMSAIPKEVYLLILLEGLLDYVLADYFWARAVLIIGPTMATLALSVQIPMAAFGDVLKDDAAWLSQSSTVMMTLMGTLLIVAGFVGINLGGGSDGSDGGRGSSGDGAAGSSHSASSSGRQGSDGNRGWPARAIRLCTMLRGMLGLEGPLAYTVLNPGIARRDAKCSDEDSLADAMLLPGQSLHQGSGAAARMRRILSRWFRQAPSRQHGVGDLIDDSAVD